MARSLFPHIAAALFVVFLTAPLFAQDVPPEIANAKSSAIGEINADGVYVRSGAGDNYYPTTKLSTGAQLTIVGVKYDWLKCLPPQGSFCYVAKAFVDKGAGDVGTVNRDDVNVRAGSDLNTLKTTVQGKLSSGQQVKILGEQDEYYKIAPPPDAFVFVKKDFVKFVKAMPQVAQTGAPGDKAAPPAEAGGPANAGTTAPTDSLIVSAPVSTQPSDANPDATTAAPTAPTQVAQGATTQPSNAEAEFDKLEADFSAASAKTIEQQPVS